MLAQARPKNGCPNCLLGDNVMPSSWKKYTIMSMLHTLGIWSTVVMSSSDCSLHFLDTFFSCLPPYRCTIMHVYWENYLWVKFPVGIPICIFVWLDGWNRTIWLTNCDAVGSPLTIWIPPFVSRIFCYSNSLFVSNWALIRCTQAILHATSTTWFCLLLVPLLCDEVPN